MRDVRLICVAASLLAAMALPASAQQWKWRDASGRVTVSDRPPPASVAEKDILQRPGGPTRAAAPAAAAAAPTAASAVPGVDAELEARKRKADREEEARRKAEEDAEAAKKKAEDAKLAAQRAENCTRARAHLRALDDGLRMARVNEKGERVIFDDKMRAEESARTRAVIASECR
jgi:hypothetical protein